MKNKDKETITAPEPAQEHPLGPLVFATRPGVWAPIKAGLLALAVILCMSPLFDRLEPWTLEVLSPLKSLKPESVSLLMARARLFLQLLAGASALVYGWRGFFLGVAVHERGLALRRGWFRSETLLVPAAQLRGIRLSRLLHQRWMGLGDLALDSGASTGPVLAEDLGAFAELEAALAPLLRQPGA